MTRALIITCNVLLVFLSALPLRAQLTLSAQLRSRTELRNGFGTLKPKQYGAAFFTSQRTRLSIDYKLHHIVLHSAVQDVRVWGQDASTINGADGNSLGLHEGWAEITLADKEDSSFKHSRADYFAVKIGRQEISYDDQRLLGALDWLQQARRHDAIVFKLVEKGWRVDLGAAFNQNTEAINYNGTYYTAANVLPYVKDSKGNLTQTPALFIPFVNAAGNSSKSGSPALQTLTSTNGQYQQYKALQYLYVAKTFKQTTVTGLLVADQFGKYSKDSVRNIAGTDTGYVYGEHFMQKGVNTRITGGILLNSFLLPGKSLVLTGGIYYQAGRDREGKRLKAYTSTLSLAYSKRCFNYIIGWDYLSGNNAFSSSTANHRFDPLYGTPHKFWGNLDYFYVGTGSPTGGLNNPFAKVKYTGSGRRLTTELAYHYFGLAKQQKDLAGASISKYLGSEVDATAAYALNKITTLEFGISVLAASRSMEYAKEITPGTSRLTATWTYLMITIKPAFLFK